MPAPLLSHFPVPAQGMQYRFVGDFKQRSNSSRTMPKEAPRRYGNHIAPLPVKFAAVDLRGTLTVGTDKEPIGGGLVRPRDLARFKSLHV